jgi:endoglucanase Acf2
MRFGWAMVLLGCGTGAAPRAPSAPPDPAAVEAVGAGFYRTQLSDGEIGPANAHGQAVSPKVTESFDGPPPTNDWWSSLIWQYADNPYSQPMFPHPLAMQAEAGGLALSYCDKPAVTARSYVYPFAREVLVGVDGLSARDTRVDSYSDWVVTAAWQDRPRSLRATFGHGLPFVYLRVAGAAGMVAPAAPVKVWHQEGEVLAFSIGGHHYAAFAPTGAHWTAQGGRFVSTGKDFFSIALLPDDSAATLALFRRHAYAFVKDSRVEWRVEAGQVVTRYRVETALAEPHHDAEPMLALYRHQWLHTDTKLLAQTYASPRGEMRMVAQREFTTRLPLFGVVPVLPVVAGEDRASLSKWVRQGAGGDLFPPGLDGKKDSYWTGKSLGRVATLAQLGDQLGQTELRDRLVRALEEELADWFDGRPPHLLAYQPTWRTLIAQPTAYQSGRQLNDHHFHYGYFVFAAATAAEFDPGWADRFGGMVDLLIKDAANWERDDRRFPMLRCFDAYAGHSWANGPALFADGNNEESSSEDVNFAAAVLLWGTASGKRELRDLGAFLYANLTAAIDQYWFDVDHAVFPRGFDHPAVGIVWGSGGAYATWWSREPVYIHGINFLPLTGASLYLGRHPAEVRRNWQGLLDANRGEPHQWRDILWMYLALADGERAAALLGRSPDFEPEFGNSRAALHHWIDALRRAGSIDAHSTADAPTALVLAQGGARTYVAWNPGRTPLAVHFSDGMRLEVPPQKLVAAPAAAGAVSQRR